MSLLAHECRRLIALQEESTLIAEPLEETLAQNGSKADIMRDQIAAALAIDNCCPTSIEI